MEEKSDQNHVEKRYGGKNVGSRIQVQLEDEMMKVTAWEKLDRDSGLWSMFQYEQQSKAKEEKGIERTREKKSHERNM